MRVVVVDQKGPKVYGYFALATEIHDDSGAPHTLEHLVFMGSKSFRYKGVLDRLATRAYSNTNAWTATDHTAYTLDTAGWEGFAQILPVYLEHVLLPTLTDAGCYTEVHHIDGSGHDAGVVYSEMQGTQNNQAELMDIRARQLIYPKSVGFRYETGGLMEALRVLSADRIRAFHKEMYQPKNLCLVLIGEVDHPQLLQILDEFESGILEDVPRLDEPFARPWTKHGRTPALQNSIRETVEFPEEDESIGEILIGLLGPDCNDDLLNAALNVLLVYLCGSSVSVLENSLVEKEQLASAVYYSTDTRPDIMIWFTISGVATEKLAAVEERFFEILREASSNGLDMEYMRDCVERQCRQLKFYSENSGNFFGDGIIYDHLFGSRDGKTLTSLGSLAEYDDLAKWDEATWNEFFTKWFIRANHVSVLGVPSKKLSKKLKKDEKARVKAQKEKLGEAGLAKLSKKLEDAKAENDKDIPRELLAQFAVPGTDSIHFISTTTATSGLAKAGEVVGNPIQSKIDQDAMQYPLFVHYEHIETNFVHVNLVLCTHQIPEELRPLLSVYTMSFFDTPIMRNGQRVDFEEIVTQLEKDTISFSIDGGTNLGNPELLRIRLQITPEKYHTAIQWLEDLLFNSIFDITRLKATLAKIMADIPEEKRSGSQMASSVINMLHMTHASSSRAQNTLVKASYLRRVKALLDTDPDSVISRMEILRKSLIDASNFRIFIIANLESDQLAKPVSSWSTLTQRFTRAKPSITPLDSRKQCLSPAGRNPGTLAYIIPMPTIDSSFANLTTKGLDSYEHPQLPALTVALAYLDAVEGPMWTAVRGTGLAYGAGFTRDVDVGLLQFKIYRSPNAFKAYVQSKQTVRALADGTVPLDDLAMEGAVSSVVVAFADEQPTMSAAATVGFVNQVVRGIPKDWGVGFMRKVREVGKEDVMNALRDIVMPVFDSKTADLVVTCAVIMQEELVKGFEADGWAPKVQLLASFQDGYGLEDGVNGDGAGVGDDEDEDEDEDAEDGPDEDGDEDEEMDDEDEDEEEGSDDEDDSEADE